MRQSRTSRARRTGGRAMAVGLAGLLAWTAGSTAQAEQAPDLRTVEYEWEVGTVKAVYDGDTLDASITRSNSGFTGTQRVRTVGVQAPETYHAGEFQEQCGAAEATRFLKSVAPVGAPVQLRAMKGTSFDTTDGRARLIRSVYAQDEEGNWYDTSRELVSSGKAMWFPFADTGEQPEWAHNLEYRVLADDAMAERRGLWARDVCGASSIPGLNIRMWAKYWGTEQVWIENIGADPIDLSGWIIRDSAIKGFRTLPPGTVINRAGTPDSVRMVYSGDMNLNNLPADNASFEGDAVYLMEPAGRYGTGNLRAWFPYPCNPDNCDDPLKTAGSGFAMKTPVPSSGPMRAPSKPGSVAAQASTDGSGNVTVTWAAPADPGGLNLRYTVTASSTPGVSVPAAATGVTSASHTFTGLTLGRAFSFSVQAVSDGGSSEAVRTTTAVTPVGLPAAPTNLTVEARDRAVAVSWSLPSTGGFDANTISYTASVVNDASKSCTVVGATSCVVDKLTNGTPVVFVVTATNPVGSSPRSAASGPAIPAPPVTATVAPAAPASVTATPGKGSIVVAWPRATTPIGEVVDSYTAAVDATHTCVATNGATSCVITGLADGTAVTATVTATTTAGTSAPSPASAAVTPFTSGTTRTSSATSAPPNATPWSPGYVDLTNNTGGAARLGGYGLWDAASSRYNNNGSIENRAAYLFAPDLTLPSGKTLRVYFGSTSAAMVPGVDQVVYASGVSAGGTGGFIELANLNGAQVACMATTGTPCVKARVTSTPSSPLGVTARTTPDSVTVNWGAPVSRGGLPISGYTATAFNDPVNGSAIGSCSTDGAGRSCAFPGSIGTKYWVQVSASNAAGTSAPSWRVLAAPRTVPSAPGGVAASGTPGGINVSWTPAAENGATITKYTAAAYTAGTGGSPVGTCTTSTGALSRCTISGLGGGTTYFVEVKATNRAGTGSPSSPRVSALPGPGTAISTYSKRRVTVRWDAPADPTGITGYTAKVYTKASKGSLLATCTAPVGATSCTTKKLKKRSKFYIDLITQTASGSSVVKPRIVTGPPRKASAPRVTSAAPSGRQVAIAWAAPTFTGYTTLKSYGARLYSKSKGGSVKASCSAGAGSLTCTTKALKRQGTYYAAVRVKNSKGWSSWSKRLKVVVR